MKTTIFVANSISKELLKVLELVGSIVTVPELDKTYESINNHPDIQIAILNNKLFIDKEAWINLNKIDLNIPILNSLKATIITSQLGNRYPLSVPFNGKFSENTWIHHLDYSDPNILAYLRKENMEMIHTKQGYSGCSLVLLPNQKGITGDMGLAKTLRANGFDILLISEGFINLKGMDYGFIGGCCGYYNNRVYVNGDLDFHKDGDLIRMFIDKQNHKIIEVKGQQLIDVGSILFYEGVEDE